MIPKLKAITGYNYIAEYITNVNWYRKLFDAILIASLFACYGVATGHIKLPENFFALPSHTVEGSLIVSKEVQKVLDVYQYNHDYTFVGNFIFHDGQSSLIESMPFMKFDLFEYSTRYNVYVNPKSFKDIPIQSALRLVSALAMDKTCYSSTPNPDNPLYVDYRRMGVTTYTACPYFNNKNGRLIAFIMVGTDGTKPIDVSTVKQIAQRVSDLQ